MASNPVSNMDEYRGRDASKHMRRQKRNKDTDLLKPKGMVFRKKEAPYRRKNRVDVNAIPVTDIKPQIDIIATRHVIGDETVIYNRNFQESPLMPNEKIEVEVPQVPVEPIDPAVVVIPVAGEPPSTEWDAAVALSAGVATPEEAVAGTAVPEFKIEIPEIPVMPKKPEAATEQPSVEIVQQTSKRGRLARGLVYGALTTVVVVGSVFAYLHFSKSGD